MPNCSRARGHLMAEPRPFCDRLTVSVPKSHDAALKDVLNEFAIQLEAVPDRVPGKWVLRSGGTFFYSRRANWAALEASGRALADLRAARVFGDYLQALGSMPWRVTRLDAALDLPWRAAPFLHDLYARASRGAVSLGRKSVDGTEVVSYLSRPLYPGEDLDTGTVYVPAQRFGSKRQYATAYDKRQERISKGLPDPGPLLRLEAKAARQKGATLSDAWDPSALFYDIMSPDIIAKPDGVPDWSAQSDTWVGGAIPASSPLQRLDRYLEGAAGRELLALADFPGGLAAVHEWLDRVERGQALAAA